MDIEITAIYCQSADFLASVGHRDDPQCEMNTAEVMTTTLTAAAFFGGDHEKSRCFLKEYGYIPDMLSKGQFNRRLHRLPESPDKQNSFLAKQTSMLFLSEGKISRRYSFPAKLPLEICSSEMTGQCFTGIISASRVSGTIS